MNSAKSVVIDHEVFAKLVCNRQETPFRPVEVAGEPDFSSTVFDKEIVFRDVVFLNGVSLRDARFNAALAFHDCVFMGPVDGSGIEVGGDLVFQDCVFRTGERKLDLNLLIEKADLRGDLTLEGFNGIESLKVNDADIRGRLRLVDFRIAGNLELNGLAVGGSVTIGGAGKSSVSAAQQSAAQREGASNIPQDKRSSLKGKLQSQGMKTGGRLKIECLVVDGHADFSHSKIGGELKIGDPGGGQQAGSDNEEANGDLQFDISIRGQDNNGTGLDLSFVECEPLELSKVRVAHSIDCEAMIAKGSSQFNQADCGGLFLLSFATIDTLFCHSLHVAGELNMFAMNCRGLVRFRNENGMHLGLRDRTENLIIADGLQLAGANIRGQLDIGYADIRGEVSFNGSEVGSFIVGAEGQRNRFGALYVVDSVFHSYVRIINTNIGLEKKPLPGEVHPRTSGAEIQNSTFHGSLFFWQHHTHDDDETGRPRKKHHAWREGSCLNSSVFGALKIVDCTIEGNLDLTRVKVKRGPQLGNSILDGSPAEDNAELVHGGIDLRRTKVNGDVKFRSPQSAFDDPTLERTERDLAGAHLGRLVGADCDRKKLEKLHEFARAEAQFLIMQGLEAGSADLTGLYLGQGEATGAASERTGHLFAEGVTIHGDMLLFAQLDKEDDEPKVCLPDGNTRLSLRELDERERLARRRNSCERIPRFYQAFTMVPGSLRLDGATVGDLKLSACGFRPERLVEKGAAGHAARDIGIVLENAGIAHLRVPPLDPIEGGTRDRFPRPLDLSGARINAWSFDLGDGGPEFHEEKEAEKYIALLAEDERLNRDIYRSVYQQMRNAGRDKAARRIFVAEHRRAAMASLEVGGLFDRQGHWLLDKARLLPSHIRYAGLALVAALAMLLIIEDALPHLKFMTSGALPAIAVLGGLTILWLSRRLLGNAIYDFLFNYGASPVRLINVILLLWAVSFFSFAQVPQNFELSDPARSLVASQKTLEALACEARGGKGCPPLSGDISEGIDYSGRLEAEGSQEEGPRSMMPDPDEWSFGEKFWVTLRYHAPIVSVIAQSDYVPTNDYKARLYWGRSGDQGKPIGLWFTPEDWFTGMMILNWILWPVLLAFLLRIAFRDSNR